MRNILLCVSSIVAFAVALDWIMQQEFIPQYAPKLTNTLSSLKVVPACSHNDEQQKIPLDLALSLGFKVIEADVFAVNGTLLIGHDKNELQKRITLRDMYFEPIFERIQKANQNKSKRDFLHGDWTGIYGNKDSLWFMVDAKEDGQAVFDALLNEINIFRDAGYLTYYDVKQQRWQEGPITIIGTGDTPIDSVIRSSPREIFFDAPLVDLLNPPVIDGHKLEWSDTIAPIASSKWMWQSYYPNQAGLKFYSELAHERGMKARWWGHARWPAMLRRKLWQMQLNADVDILNADDLEDVAAFLRNRKSSSGY